MKSDDLYLRSTSVNDLYPKALLPQTTLHPPTENYRIVSFLNDFRGFWTLFCGLVESAVYLPKLCFIGLVVGFLAGLIYPQNRSLEDLEDLREATVLITGASMGVGEHLAYLFASRGVKLFLTSRSEKRLREVAAHCERLGASKVYYEMANMVNTTNIEEITKAASTKFNNRLDFLILNHALPTRASFWHGKNQDVDDLNLFLQVNFVSYAQLTSSFLPVLKVSRGRVVAISSILARHPFPHFLINSVTKSALESFFVGLRQELAARRDKVSVTLALLGSPISQRKRVNHHDLSSIFNQDPWNETAECIIFGAYDRSREVFCPQWLVYPFSVVLNVPFFRPMLEKFLAFYLEKNY
uniref:Uncharacterized protein n=1 Tax=Romanomermis culicivorax TaxID=13658 RepID=A0A915IH17_ROMCU